MWSSLSSTRSTLTSRSLPTSTHACMYGRGYVQDRACHLRINYKDVSDESKAAAAEVFPEVPRASTPWISKQHAKVWLSGLKRLTDPAAWVTLRPVLPSSISELARKESGLVHACCFDRFSLSTSGDEDDDCCCCYYYYHHYHYYYCCC